MPGSARRRTLGRRRLWWVQPEGDLWIMRAHWYGGRVPDDAAAALRGWAIAITPSGTADIPYVLAGNELSLIAFDAAGDKPSRSRVWSYEGHELTLLFLDGSSSAAGLSNLLANGAPTRTDVPGLGRVWVVGRTFGWAVSQSGGAWATLLVPEGLAGDADVILRALRGVGVRADGSRADGGGAEVVATHVQAHSQ